MTVLIAAAPVAEAPPAAPRKFGRVVVGKKGDDDKPKHATVYIYAEIGESFWSESVTAKDFIDELDALPESVKTIDLRLNSPGGSVFDGRAIFNALQRHPAKVTSYVDGVAASMASEIMLAGDKVVIAENAFVMIHNPWGFAMGDAAEMRKAADLLDKMRGSMIKRYADKSGKSEKEIGKLVDAETWFEGKEAVDFGLADEVLASEDEDVEAAACAEWDIKALQSFKHPPGRLVAAMASGAPKFGRATGSPSTNDDTTKGATMDIKAMARALGMPEDSTEEQVLARAAELRNQSDDNGGDSPADDTDNADDDADEGSDDSDDDSNGGGDVVSIDRGTLTQLQANAEAGRKAREQQLAKERDDTVKAAVRAGKIPAARAAHWSKLMASDPAGTKAQLDNLEPGLIPVGPETGSTLDAQGNSVDGGSGDGSAYPSEWLSAQEKRRIARAQKQADSGTNPRIAYANEGAGS